MCLCTCLWVCTFDFAANKYFCFYYYRRVEKHVYPLHTHTHTHTHTHDDTNHNAVFLLTCFRNYFSFLLSMQWQECGTAAFETLQKWGITNQLTLNDHWCLYHCAWCCTMPLEKWDCWKIEHYVVCAPDRVCESKKLSAAQLSKAELSPLSQTNWQEIC